MERPLDGWGTMHVKNAYWQVVDSEGRPIDSNGFIFPMAKEGCTCVNGCNDCLGISDKDFM